MTREEIIKWLESLKAEMGKSEHSALWHYAEVIDIAIEALTNQSLSKSNNTCKVDLISRKDAIEAVEKAKTARSADGEIFCAKINAQMNIQHLPPIRPKIIRCKDCKHFTLNFVENVDGVPLIVAHEICSFWGDGCKTSQESFCSFGEWKDED